MKNLIKNLLLNNRMREAIEVLREKDIEGAIEVQARHNRFLRDIISGVLSHEEQTLALNRIRQSVLLIAGIDDYECTPEQVRPLYLSLQLNSLYYQYKKLGLQLLPILEGMILTYKNKNPRVVVEAKKLWQEYLNLEKEGVISNKELGIIEQKLADLIDFASKKREEVKDESKEVFAKKIMGLFNGLIASESVLKEAYDLCKERGFADTWIENKLSKLIQELKFKKG